MNLFNKIKNAFSGTPEEPAEFERIVQQTRAEYAAENRNFFGVPVGKTRVYQDVVAQWPDRRRVRFIVYCVEQCGEFSSRQTTWSSGDVNVQVNYVRLGYIDYVLKVKLRLEDEDVRLLYTAFYENPRWRDRHFMAWPVAAMILQIERQYKGQETGISPDLAALLRAIRGAVAGGEEHYYPRERAKLLDRIDGLLHRASGSGDVKPTLFADKDDFAAFANPMIGRQPGAEKKCWYRLLALAQKAGGGKPTAKYLNEGKAIVTELGVGPFRRMVQDWFGFVVQFREKITRHTQTYNGQAYSYTSHEFLDAGNIDTLKGLVWVCALFADGPLLRLLAALAERCYRKIPGHGPAAAAVSNACFFALYKAEGLEGIGQLSRLRLRIKQSNAQGLIERYLHEAATEQGVSLHEIEDLAVDDFGLHDGALETAFDDYRAVIEVSGPGKSELQWYRPDGAPQKSAPAFAREKYAAQLKRLQDLRKQIDQTTLAQRDRIDRMFRTDRRWTAEHFRSLYLEHGLMSSLARKLIWTFHSGDHAVSAIWSDGGWTDNNGSVVHPAEGAAVSLWHPAVHTVAEIKKWRDFLLARQIRQPLKQAFREVYLLTDAEVNTVTYSNRMAAHLLKQHQFNNLAKMRGWKYSLLGAYDDGRYNEAAQLTLEAYRLRAEFWVNEVNAENAMNDTGIWNYVATDQIRFLNLDTGAPVRLAEAPAVAFSEALRDVDLFVGVASVGNDPAWQDSGGLPAYRDYWTTYSFGDLSEVAKTRHEVLTGLVPRLKIGQVARVSDKFLVVKGKLRTYKIHIGSTNILMEPNDQYLCIVPDRSKTAGAPELFLPFEGDTGLSIILSKAFLLAEDDKITDSTITSQINRR